MLEKLIGDLIAALNANTEAVKASSAKTTRKGKDDTAAPASVTTAAPEQPKPAAETPKPASEAPKIPEPVYPTETDVVNAANALMEVNGNDGSFATKINEEFNVPVIDNKRRLRNAEPAKRAAIIERLKKLTEEAKKAGAESV